MLHRAEGPGGLGTPDFWVTRGAHEPLGLRATPLVKWPGNMNNLSIEAGPSTATQSVCKGPSGLVLKLPHAVYEPQVREQH